MTNDLRREGATGLGQGSWKFSAERAWRTATNPALRGTRVLITASVTGVVVRKHSQRMSAKSKNNGFADRCSTKQRSALEANQSRRDSGSFGKSIRSAAAIH